MTFTDSRFLAWISLSAIFSAYYAAKKAETLFQGRAGRFLFILAAVSLVTAVQIGMIWPS
jgi:hypothetical protein